MNTSKALWIEKELAPKMEGHLYEHIYITTIGDQYLVCKDFYTVHDGLVYMVNDGRKQATGDTLENTNNECVCIGKYDSKAIYQRKLLYYDKEEIKKLLKLD